MTRNTKLQTGMIAVCMATAALVLGPQGTAQASSTQNTVRDSWVEGCSESLHSDEEYHLWCKKAGQDRLIRVEAVCSGGKRFTVHMLSLVAGKEINQTFPITAKCPLFRHVKSIDVTNAALLH